MRTRTVPAGQFKQRCLAMLEEVAARHEELTITKRGRPVARVVPVTGDREREEEILSALRSRTHILVSDEELIRPLGGEAGWQTLAGDERS